MHSVNNASEGMTYKRPAIPDVPFYPGTTYQSSDSSESTNINTDIKIDFEENSPFQEGVISEA